MNKQAKIKSLQNPELIDLFNVMVGNGKPEPKIIAPKYERLYTNCSNIVSILSSFRKNLGAHPIAESTSASLNEISQFVSKGQADLASLKAIEVPQSSGNLTAMSQDQAALQKFLELTQLKYDLESLQTNYKALKECPTIKEIIMTIRNLKVHLELEKKRTQAATHNLENIKQLSSDFILRADGSSLTIFSFSQLDFKFILNDGCCDPGLTNYILQALYLIYNKGLTIVKDITSPDIDIARFSELLVGEISGLRKYIPRCDKAFNEILRSVKLLENNFGEYYKDFVSSRNPGIMIENFVMDIAKSTKDDVVLKSQFRRIVMFCKSNMKHKFDDPKIEMVFNLLNSNLDILDEKSKKTKTEDSDKDSKEEKEEVNESKKGN